MKHTRFIVILLGVIFNSSFLFADSTFDPNTYRRFVTYVETTHEDEKKSTRFILSDNTEWCLTKDEPLIDPETFELGTEIYVSTTIFLADGEGIISVIEYSPAKEPKKMSILGWISPNSQNLLPTIKQIHKICIKEAGWFSSAQYIYVLELSDGSKWKKNSDSEWKNSEEYVKDYWAVNDHILISSRFGSDYQEWSFINVDKLTSISESWERIKDQHMGHFRKQAIITEYFADSAGCNLEVKPYLEE